MYKLSYVWGNSIFYKEADVIDKVFENQEELVRFLEMNQNAMLVTKKVFIIIDLRMEV